MKGRRIRGVGRPQKVDRQEIIGAVAAVRHWMTMNHEDRLAKAERMSRTVLALLMGIPGLDASVMDNVIGHQPFGVRLNVDPAVTGMTNNDLVDALKDGDPPVWTRVKEGEDFIAIHMFGLRDGEEQTVGERIAAVFDK